jgi:hypothetical protein
MHLTRRLRAVLLIALGAAVMALVLTLVSNPHALPAPIHKPWSEWTLKQQESYVRANLRHARGVIGFAASHRKLYRPAALVHVLHQHRRLEAKARRNLRAIMLRLHPPFRYPWWWVPLGVCETGVNPPDPAYGAPGHPGGDGYHGFINFAPSTWDTYKQYVPSARRYAYAYQAPEYVQFLVTMAMHNSGVPWSQSNPACSARIGLR